MKAEMPLLGDTAPIAAVACLLLPTLLALYFPSETEYLQLFRAVLGIVAFVVLMLRRDFTAGEIVKTVQEDASDGSIADSAKLTEQVAILLPQLHPTATCLQTTADLEELVDDRVSAILPGSSVKAYVSGPFWRNSPHVTSVPEIEVVVSMPMSRLQDMLQGQMALDLDQSQILKRSLKVLLKRLLATDDFFFRRSSFGSPEAKVTLVARRLGDPSQVVAFSLYLNSSSPAHGHALKAACAKLWKPFNDLNLLIRRWTKVRGLCNWSYFPPYVWILLLIHYLQRCEKPCLPLLHCSVDSAGEPWVTASTHFHDACPATCASVDALVAKHFAGFMQFYKSVFNWEMGQVRIAADQPALSLVDCLTICDPFQNDCVYCSKLSSSLSRLTQEIQRASELINNEAHLSNLLEQWIPNGEGEVAQE